MRPDLAAKYDLRVPRYTSYPTAPHFSETVGAREYAAWLKGLDPTLPLSLYLHIAYCAEMCWFCGCHTKITHRYAPIADYMDCLWREIDMVAGLIPSGMSASHIHFGGGSPTILSPEDFAATIGHLRARFGLRPGAEIAVELDPRTADRDYVHAMAQAGVTRASLGVQDFNPAVQQAINRIQPYDMTAQVIDWLREDGISAINMDLIYGLPYQTAESLMETVDLAAGFAPSRIALFGYAHVPWMKKHQRLIPEEALPDVPERWRQYELVAHRLVAKHGYVQIGLDHFARPEDALSTALAKGRLHRNFQGYTTDNAPALIGFGASGIGFLPQGYVANETDIHAYKRLIRADVLATRRGIALNDDDRLRAALIERLMCDLTLDVEAICRRFNADPAQFDEALARLAPLQADGLLFVEGRTIRMTDEGHPLVRAACAVFDRYLTTGEARHSKAV